MLRPPRSPLLSVTSIAYTDATNSPQVLDPSAYQVDTISQPGRILPAYGTVWPVTLEVPNAVRITFVAGYSVLPPQVAAVIMMMVAVYWARREDYETSRRMVLPLGLRVLIASLDAGRYP